MPTPKFDGNGPPVAVGAPFRERSPLAAIDSDETLPGSKRRETNRVFPSGVIFRLCACCPRSSGVPGIVVSAPVPWLIEKPSTDLPKTSYA